MNANKADHKAAKKFAQHFCNSSHIDARNLAVAYLEVRGLAKDATKSCPHGCQAPCPHDRQMKALRAATGEEHE